MHCPYCQNEVPDSSAVCPVCHADIAAAQRRAQAASHVVRPVYTQSSASHGPQPGQSRSSFENESTSVDADWGQTAATTEDTVYQYPPIREQIRPAAEPVNPLYAAAHTGEHLVVDMSRLDPAPHRAQEEKSAMPKWPLVLIAILLVFILVAAGYLVLSTLGVVNLGGGQSSTTVTSTAEESSSVDGNSISGTLGGASSQATDAAGTSAGQTGAVAVVDDATAYAELSGAYEAASGFDSSIAELAARFNNESLLEADEATRQAAMDSAGAVLDEIQSWVTRLESLNLAADSVYASNLESQKTMYNDLYQRMNILYTALRTTLNGSGIDAATSIVASANDVNGVNRYKAEYDSIYPTAQPQAPAA